MNTYDSDKIVGLLAKSHDFILTNSPATADLIILNTCSVRHKAEEKLFSDLGRIRKFKLANPNITIGVGGCVASQERENIIRRAPYVDLVFGPQTLHRLPNMYTAVIEARDAKPKFPTIAQIDVSFPALEKFDYFPEPKTDGPSALVAIMEGCNKFCSYCIVPHTRGREFSRPVADVMLEIDSLIAQGVKEVILLGQNVNDYQGLTANQQHITLAELIYQIAEKPQIEIIRFITSHPATFGDDLIAAYANIPKLADHLHLPVQSGSDCILTAMRRGYTMQEYQNKIHKLRQVRPNISISSDFIVGFPGETDADFQATMDLIGQIGFDASFSFIYSPRPNTPAAKLPDDVPFAEKQTRLNILQNTIAMNAMRISKSMIGSTQKVLVTGMATKRLKNQYTGRTSNNRTVNFTAEQNFTGQIVNVNITAAITNSLLGETEDGIKS